jgi:DNA repair protein RecO (recombination protein O)
VVDKSAAHVTETLALVLGRTAFGDADLIVSLFTEAHGKLSALARGARRSQKRFAGSLEPIHTIRVELTPPQRGELYTLKSAHLAEPRAGLLNHLGRMNAAGRAISWVKRATSSHVSETGLWQSLNGTLDELGRCSEQDADDVAASFGLRLLDLMGWGINFLSCISCGKPCPSERSAWVNPERGGLVCQACGGGPFQMAGPHRHALHQVACGQAALPPHDAVAVTIKIVERSLGAHLGWQDGGGLQDLGQRRKT